MEGLDNERACEFHGLTADRRKMCNEMECAVGRESSEKCSLMIGQDHPQGFLTVFGRRGPQRQNSTAKQPNSTVC